MYDQTIRQKKSAGTPLVQVHSLQGALARIKPYAGAKPLAGFPNASVIEGLGGLRDCPLEYRAIGVGFAKLQAVIYVTNALASSACVSANADAARMEAVSPNADQPPSGWDGHDDQ